MWLRHLWAGDFRSYDSIDLELTEGLTAFVGANGAGKSNVLEAVSLLASGESFRGAQSNALIREGRPNAVVRGEFVSGARQVLVETEISPGAKANRTLLNRQKISRLGELIEVLAVTVFAPEDLSLMKGPPAVRRDAIDGAVVAVTPTADRERRDLARILRQRNALLRQSGGRLSEDIAVTLDVWDDRLARTGEAWTGRRVDLVERLEPAIQKSYAELSGVPSEVCVRYLRSWDGELASALTAGRSADLKRGVSLVGPHRDEIRFTLDGLPARTHASQGEQRTLSLALRLAVHRLVAAARGESPVLLLDDVFSELDPARSEALLTALPPGQALLTTASVLPPGATPERIVEITGPQL